MCRSLISDCRHYQAGLHAFVVMSNHIHLVCNVPAHMTASTLMQRIKTNSSKVVQPLLESWQLEALSTQRGLSNRRMWHTRFHSLVLETALMFDIRINYITQSRILSERISSRLLINIAGAACI
jgi:REP element-mobilizing transposase RayT